MPTGMLILAGIVLVFGFIALLMIHFELFRLEYQSNSKNIDVTDMSVDELMKIASVEPGSMISHKATEELVRRSDELRAEILPKNKI